jgi:hypothetical protein
MNGVIEIPDSVKKHIQELDNAAKLFSVLETVVSKLQAIGFTVDCKIHMSEALS